MSTIVIVEADLQWAEHQQAIVHLINSYAQEPLISGKPLTAEVQQQLIPRLQQHPTTMVLLAYQEEAPVGIAVCFLGFSTFKAQPILNIHDLAVLAENRGQGVGRALLEAAEDKARELGCCKMTLEVDDANRAARHVYEAAGFIGSQHVAGNGPAYFLSKPLLA